MGEDVERFRGYLETAISTLPPDREQVIKYKEVCNQILADIDIMNSSAIQRVIGDPATRAEFAKRHNIREEYIPDFKLPGYNVPELKISLNDTLDAGFKGIYNAWKKSTTITTNNKSDL